MSNEQYLYLYFSKNDQDVLAWANMIRESGLSLNTWIQGILVADATKEELKIGAVFVPNAPQTDTTKTSNPMTSLFGDDTTKPRKTKPSVGWDIRGENGTLKSGSILSIKITRPAARAAIDETKKNHKRLGPYIKALIRKNMTTLCAGPNKPPNQADVLDIFALCESKLRRTPPDKRPLKANQHQPQRGKRKEESNTPPKLAPLPVQPRPLKSPNQAPQKTKSPLLKYIDG